MRKNLTFEIKEFLAFLSCCDFRFFIYRYLNLNLIASLSTEEGLMEYQSFVLDLEKCIVSEGGNWMTGGKKSFSWGRMHEVE